MADESDIGAIVYFNGAVFDGRYVTYPPDGDNEVVRYDTRRDFGSEEAWERFDQRDLDSHASSFGGGAFDGRYLYLIPKMNSVIARFEVRDPPEMPDAYAGAF